MSNRINILVKNSSWVYLAKITVQIIGFVVNILVVRKLSVEIYGTYNFLLSTLTFINIFALSSVTSVFNRFIPELAENKDIPKLLKLLKVGVLSSVGIFVLLSLMIYVFRKPYAEIFNIQNIEIYLLALFVYMFFSYSKAIFDNIIKSLLLHKNASVFAIINSLFTAVLLIIFLPRLTVNILLYISAAGAFVYLIPSIFIIIRYFKTIKYEKINSVKLKKKEVVRYAAYSSLNELGAGIIGKTSDNFIVAGAGNQYFVGLYSFSLKLYKLVFKLLPMKDFLTVLRPLFLGKFTKEFNKNEFDKVYNFIVKVMLLVYSLPFIYFFSFGKPFIEFIYGAKYFPSFGVLVLLLAGNFIAAYFYPLGLTIILKKRMEIAFYAKIIVVFSIFVGIWGMKNFGIMGVALATLIGDLLKNALMLFLAKRIIRIKYYNKEFIKIFALIFVLSILFYFLSSLFVKGIISLIIFSIIFGAISFVSFIFFHPFRKDELEYFNKMKESSKILRKLSQLVIFIFEFKPRLNN